MRGRTLASEGPYDTACFHAQQAAEKYLKAVLALRGYAIPKTHDLEELAQSAVRLEPSLQLTGLELGELTSHGVDSRYDVEFWPDRETAAAAVAVAAATRSQVALLLSVPPLA
jgi:HEPN domain-containing protein